MSAEGGPDVCVAWPRIVCSDFETGPATTLGFHNHDAGGSRTKRKKIKRSMTKRLYNARIKTSAGE